MSKSLAAVPYLIAKSISESQIPVRYHLPGVAILGAVLIGALAQVRVSLPYTPVPITGQTFGVSLIALSFGSRFGVAAVGVYLGAGALGVPVFSGGRAGMSLGPTVGYLMGMLLSAMVVGRLADLGWARKFGTAVLAAFLGSLCVYACGLVVLGRFVPKDQLLFAGVIPFLPGDIIKTFIAAGVASGLNSWAREGSRERG